MVKEAREWVEDYTGRALIDQTWRQTMVSGPNSSTGIYSTSSFSMKEIQLRRSPVLAVTSVTKIDSAGARTVLDADTYEVLEPDSKWPRLVMVNRSAFSGSHEIEFRAGFADRTGSPLEDASAVPVVCKRAIKLIAAHYSEHRTPLIVGTIASELALTIKWLLASQRAEMGAG
jgi:uncharacterized phiE125 gp8 family phage protein